MPTNNGTAKTDTFSEMINEYLVYSNILFEEFKSQNWMMQKANIKPGWNGGDLIVPFQQSYASSVRMGGLAATDDVDNASYVRGKINGYQEVYATLLFNSKDLFEHNRISETNFLKILPDQITQTMKFAKQQVSIQVLNGGGIDAVVSGFAGGNDGLLNVKHPERFMIGMKIIAADADTSVGNTGTPDAIPDVYVALINKNTAILTCRTARGAAGGSLVNMTGLDATTTIYTENQRLGVGGGKSFTSLKDMLLPASLGGSDTFATKTKTDQPFTQPVLYDATRTSGDWQGSADVDGNTILTLIFDAYRKGIQLGAEPIEWAMSWKHYSAALLAIEKGSGGFKNVKPAVNYAGYSSITVGGAIGAVVLSGVRELNDDFIYGINPMYFDFHVQNQPWRIMTSPDGLKYFTVRNTTGYQYLIDMQMLGDFIYRHPWSATVIHSIPDYEVSAIT